MLLQFFSDCYFEIKMLIYFTDSWDKTKKESIDIEELLQDIVKNNFIKSSKDLSRCLDPFLQKMFTSTTRSWIDTLFSDSEPLTRTYFVHVHVHKSRSSNLRLTVAVYQRELKTLQNIAAWRMSNMLQSTKQIDELISQSYLPQILKPEIVRFMQH